VIVETAGLSQFFEKVVHESLHACRVEARAGTETYLVTLLEDFVKPQRPFERPISLLLDEALSEKNAGERFEKLRALGDGVLFAAGFFSECFERRGVDAKFVCAVGARAYGGVSEMLFGAELAREMDVFGELSTKFDAFVLVISDVAEQTMSGPRHYISGQDVLRIYERWLKTGSERLAEALGEHGLAPSRAVKGIH